MILALKTDQFESAEVYLLTSDGTIRQQRIWSAGRRLTADILAVVTELLAKESKTIADISGVIVYSGPGSFTGLRIATAVGNSVAAALGIAVVGAQSEQWLQDGIKRIAEGGNDRVVVPEYGAAPHITTPRR